MYLEPVSQTYTLPLSNLFIFVCGFIELNLRKETGSTVRYGNPNTENVGFECYLWCVSEWFSISQYFRGQQIEVILSFALTIKHSIFGF